MNLFFGKALSFFLSTRQFITHVRPDAELGESSLKLVQTKTFVLKLTLSGLVSSSRHHQSIIEKQFVTSAFCNLSLGLATNCLNWKSIKR